MSRIGKSSVVLGLVMALSAPTAGFAQSGAEALAQRVEQQQERVRELQQQLQRADRVVTVNQAEVRRQLDAAQRQLDESRAALKQARSAQKDKQNAQGQRQKQADQEREQRKAERRAQREAERRAEREAERQAERQAQREAERRAEQQAQREAERRAQREAELEAELEAERRAQRQAERQAQRQAEREAERRAAERQAQRQAERQALLEEERREQRRAERRAERQAERRAAAAAADGDRPVGRIEREQLTDDNTRASNEEFDTDVRGNESDGGLSKFEKALILGLGAVAVGKILDNGDEVVSRSGDRVVVERDGDLRVLKDDDALLRRPGNDLQTETFDDGSTRTTVTKPDGNRIVTIRGADGAVLRRTRVTPSGEQIELFDDTQRASVPTITTQSLDQGAVAGERDLRAALEAERALARGEGFSLRQVRDIEEVRSLVPQIELDQVTFATGSAAIEPEQARSLARIGNTLRDLIEDDPRTVLLIEGHTDAVGDASYNLALSDRRAETVALALTEYFDVPPENMIVQGYGESQLKVRTALSEPANRRAVVRDISTLLR
ncbi:OmpA family protein [Sulfitobacter albidus]|uniref:OmpA family protein n=1 Tax=Sulfitobacter albidus TaxID=2829501 RepID=A0A975JFS2_9RHOB|nr:OmpA family protein [Sulfitobacter albidus]QUJ77455.1 OmpA family protein [Sulfitobacter albidus]